MTRAVEKSQSLSRTGTVEQIEWVGPTTLALLRSGPAEDAKAQIWLYEGLIAEGWPVTDHRTDVAWFKPFAAGFAYRADDPKPGENHAIMHQNLAWFSHYLLDETLAFE